VDWPLTSHTADNKRFLTDVICLRKSFGAAVNRVSVCGQTAGRRKRFVTQYARVRLQSGVSALVPDEMTRVAKRLVANSADVGPFARVYSFVKCKCRGLVESGAAYVTGVRPVSAVYTSVCGESARVGERFPADVAYVSFLAGVYKDVRSEVTELAERSVTDVARVRLSAVVFAPVFREIARHRERLVAYLAYVRLVVRVDPFVCSEVTVRGECPTTFVAFVQCFVDIVCLRTAVFVKCVVVGVTSGTVYLWN